MQQTPTNPVSSTCAFFSSGYVSPLACDQISVHYQGKEVISSFSFEFRSGVYALVGANGTGKSTLLKMLSGLIKPTKGILRAGHDSEKLSTWEVKSRSFFLPDCRSFPNRATTETMINFCDTAYGIRMGNDKRVKCLAADLEIDELLKYKFCELSFGMRTRLFLYCALRVNPGVLLLDEPFNGLDEIFFQKVVQHLLNEASKTIILFSTHSERAVKELDAEVLSFPL